MSSGMKFVINQQGKCTTCSQAVVAGESITCCSCSIMFHAHSCSASDKQDAICTSSLLKLFTGNTTKNNFKWFCDVCLTKFEINKATVVEDRFHEIMSQVTKMADMLNDVKSNVTAMSAAKSYSPEGANGHTISEANGNSASTINNCSPWHNNTRVENMRSSLIVKSKPGNQPTQVDLNRVKSLAVKNKIPVSKVGVSGSGHTFIHCPSIKDRDKLQPILTADLQDNEVVALKEKLPHVSIVDIYKSNTDDITSSNFRDEILQQVRNQNHQIGTLIDSGDEFTILFVKPGNASNKCTAVVRVSCRIRDLIKTNRNRLFIGISSCRVFDRFFIKRCNKCQGFGHYKGNCPNQEVCGYCGEGHSSEGCPLKETDDFCNMKCINCKRNNLSESGHSTFWPSCPSYIAAQKKLRSTIPYYENKVLVGPSLNV